MIGFVAENAPDDNLWYSRFSDDHFIQLSGESRLRRRKWKRKRPGKKRA
jgi:hypothetical protein